MPLLLLLFQILFLARVTSIEHYWVTLGERRGAERLKVIADMNHHIRNALQVIAYHSTIREDKKSVAVIDDAVKRISWALREVLPQLPPDF